MVKDFLLFPQGAQITLIIVAAVLLASAFYLIYQKGIKIGGKGLSVSIGGGDSEIISNSLSSIATKTKEKVKIQHLHVVRKQMFVAEVYVSQAISTLRHTYLSLLKEKGVEDIVSTNDFSSFENVLAILESGAIDEIRKIVLENHFIEKNQGDFALYAFNKTKKIMDYGSKLINDRYLFNGRVKRDELYERNSEDKSRFEEMGTKFFDECRDISEKYDSEVKKLDKEIAEIANKFKKDS